MRERASERCHQRDLCSGRWTIRNDSLMCVTSRIMMSYNTSPPKTRWFSIVFSVLFLRLSKICERPSHACRAPLLAVVLVGGTKCGRVSSFVDPPLWQVYHNGGMHERCCMIDSPLTPPPRPPPHPRGPTHFPSLLLVLYYDELWPVGAVTRPIGPCRATRPT